MLRIETIDGAATAFAVPGDSFYAIGDTGAFLTWALPLTQAGADGVCCAGSPKTVRELANHAIPVCGHVGPIPGKATWTGGLKAAGKTLDGARRVWDACAALADAGAFAVEIAVVPQSITRAISERTDLFLIAMGAGAAGHAQYPIADDVPGQNRGHVPRHARVHADFTADHARLQDKRSAATGSAIRRNGASDRRRTLRGEYLGPV